MVNPNKESKDKIVLIYSIIKSKHESEKGATDKEKEKKKGFDEVKEYIRMRRMSDERFLEAQDMIELKDGKEKLNE